MDLPGESQSALGSTYRVERELGRGGPWNELGRGEYYGIHATRREEHQ